MTKLNKKQVKGLINIINSKNIYNRPILQNIGLTESGGKITLVATDSYQLHAISLNDAIIKPEFMDAYQSNKLIISNKTINDWYKLADSKTLLSENDLLNMVEASKEIYPDITRLIKEQQIKPTERIMFNSKFLVNAEMITGEFVQLQLNGEYNAISYQSNDHIGIILPMRK